ncbi:E3 SUMO-protein ligase KIAA1586-like [Aphis craccivora]|uniref:E3 SUMO-protein ligase KIAA1586-like n=1 Tax=Aphis craccivora TaxID=307492 RepID=A0A6G0VS05_APHCR|nr:E3 SUMO-protein ligase KIAA1586-like [Aphis craccivora]
MSSKYTGLYKKLGSPQFVLDLALMYDILKELSYLFNQLQSHTVTLLQAYQLIKRTIRVLEYLESFKTLDGEHVSEAKEAQIIMLFKTINVDIRHGENEIQQLGRRFVLNTSVLVQGMRNFIHNNTMNEEIQELNILIKTLPVSTAECERGFSLMNITCSDLRSKLTIKNKANLMFININGPPLSIWKMEPNQICRKLAVAAQIGR